MKLGKTESPFIVHFRHLFVSFLPSFLPPSLHHFFFFFVNLYLFNRYFLKVKQGCHDFEKFIRLMVIFLVIKNTFSKSCCCGLQERLQEREASTFLPSITSRLCWIPGAQNKCLCGQPRFVCMNLEVHVWPHKVKQTERSGFGAEKGLLQGPSKQCRQWRMLKRPWTSALSLLTLD